MKAATLFSGIGAPEVAMPHWQWCWAAENAPFPSTVYAHRHPTVPNLGDVTADDFVTKAEAAGRPDVLVFGSPCQAFSVAGKRLGLDDPRGNLALIALGIARRLKPRWIVFENVPGFLSASEGRDFGLFLRAVEEAGYFGAWASLDAQWRGLAQRRERLFFVGRLGDWRGPAAVLLEPESLHGHHPPRREPSQDAARTLAGGARGRGGYSDEDRELVVGALRHTDGGADLEHGRAGLIPEVAGTMPAAAGTERKHGHGWGQQEFEQGYIIPEVAGTIEAAAGRSRGAGTPPGGLLPVAFGGNNTAGEIDVATAVRAKANGTGHIDFESETFLVTPFDTTQITHPENRSNPQPGDPAPSLATKGHPPAIAFSCKDSGQDASDVAPTLRAMNNDDGNANAGGQVAVVYQQEVADPITEHEQGTYTHEGSGNFRTRNVIAEQHPPTVAFQTRFARNGRGGPEEEIAPPLTAQAGRTGKGDSATCIATSMAVRRLTPRECERLQGFPDDFTLVDYRGKLAKDGPRYAAIGNSMAVPVMRMILERLEFVDHLLEGETDA